MTSENSSKFNSPLLSLSADLKSFAIWASVNAMCAPPEAAANASNFLYASVNSLKESRPSWLDEFFEDGENMCRCCLRVYGFREKCDGVSVGEFVHAQFGVLFVVI